MSWTIEKTSNVCQTLRISYEENEDWEQWGLLGADAHVDNAHCDLELKKEHYEQAKKRGAFICEFGDFLDLMQGKKDKRSDKNDLRPELLQGRYLNNVVDFGFSFLEPYKENIALISKGNHETAMEKHYEFDPLDSMVGNLRGHGSPVVLGGYRGWLRFLFERASGGRRMSYRGYYNHGGGGGGPVTKGVIKTNRRAVFLPEADFVFSGHIHEAWVVELQRLKLLDSGREINDTQYHVQIPTYKEESANIAEGFHIEREAPPKPLGAWWIRFFYNNRRKRIGVQFIRTQQ